jgi:hypothetical protein
MVTDRVHPVETSHTMRVEHRHEVIAPTEETLKRMRALAMAAGLDPSSMPACIDVTPEKAPAP